MEYDNLGVSQEYSAKLTLKEQGEVERRYVEQKRDPKKAFMWSVFLGYFGAGRIYLRHYFYGGFQAGCPLSVVLIYLFITWVPPEYPVSQEMLPRLVFYLWFITTLLVSLFANPVFWIMEIVSIKKLTKIENNKLFSEITSDVLDTRK